MSGLDAFPEQIRTGVEFSELMVPVEKALDAHMPRPGVYTLRCPLNPTENRHRRTHAALRQEIVDWVQAAGRELHAEAPEREDRHRRPGGYQGQRTVEIDGLEFTLDRRVHWSEDGRHDGRLFVSRAFGPDLEDLRRQRLATALDRKLGKLMACKAEGDAAILILEFSDIALTNHIFIAQALEALLAGRDDVPDYVVIADTTLETAWTFWQPVIDGAFSIQMEWIETEPLESLSV